MGHWPSPPPPGSGTASSPLIERAAGWSAAHRKTAVFGWLLLVAAAIVAGQLLGTRNVQSYDPGQAGRAEHVLNQPNVQTPPSENVLIQARSSRAGFATGPRLRLAAAQLTEALQRPPGSVQHIRSPLGQAAGT